VAKTAEGRMMCFGLRLVPVEYLLDGEGGIELVVEDKVEVDMLGELSRSETEADEEDEDEIDISEQYVGERSSQSQRKVS